MPKHPGGRPPLFDNAEDMQAIIDDYFDSLLPTEDNPAGEFPTISGLALALGMTTKALREYGERDEFSSTVRKAKQKVELSWEQRLLQPGSGPIFWLKNNAGWKDKTETEHTGNLTVNITRFADNNTPE